ncbi:MAG: hypothetical protein L6365_05650 [Desulfobulbaceae bacterium]|nr:hypothetical protein [Pseudomonadota bacterium]MCG2746997.1 hypothetical protein [Desulfobulbaceae bacterium]
MAKLQEDTLPKAEGPDRVFYETGVLLNADDFQAEQDYHRGRLARALAYVIGSGTVAGLKVAHEEAVPPDTDGDGAGREERLKVAPGLAIDPLGRMIEVPRHLCIRLERWYQAQTNQDLREGWHDTDIAWVGAPAGVVVDLVLKFVSCERGKTPNFAKGPFAALDAVTTARLRDGYEAALIIRKEANPPLPVIPWSGLVGLSGDEERSEKFRELVYDAWKTGTSPTTSVFIARIVIEATAPDGDDAPPRTNDNHVTINNKIRPFVISANALAQWLGVDLTLGEDGTG